MQAIEETRDRQGEAVPLVLLPGTLCDARVFEPLQDRLAPLRTQVLQTHQARSLEEAAAQVLERAPQQFALLGFSLGGMVAMEVALRARGRVCALALLSTTPLAVPPERHADRLADVDAARDMGMARFVRERLWPKYGDGSREEAMLPLLQQMAESLDHTAFALQTEMALRRTDYRTRLKEIHLPSLVIGGTADALCPPAVQHELATSLAGSRLVLLPGAGHFTLLEQPDEVAAAVAAWFHTVQDIKERVGGTAGVQPNPEEST